MAKATIIFEDTEEEGGVSFRVEFDPPLSTTSDEVSPAQAEAIFVTEIMHRRAEGQTLAQMAEEINEEEYGDIVEGSMTTEDVLDENEEDLS